MRLWHWIKWKVKMVRHMRSLIHDKKQARQASQPTKTPRARFKTRYVDMSASVGGVSAIRAGRRKERP